MTTNPNPRPRSLGELFNTFSMLAIQGFGGVLAFIERELVEKKTADPREPNTLYVAWRGEHTGKALDWWVKRLREPRLMKRLVNGVAVK